METSIIGFRKDEAGDFVAELACGHGQHVRHRPPWQERPWVTTEEGRQGKIGASIDCPLCDRIALPPAAREYKRTAIFTEETLPEALRREHRTKAGVWARVVVSEGSLEFHSRARRRVLGPGDVAIAEPEILHSVIPRGPVRLHVEFWRVE
jgi:tellurite methyltransferase